MAVRQASMPLTRQALLPACLPARLPAWLFVLLMWGSLLLLLLTVGGGGRDTATRPMLQAGGKTTAPLALSGGHASKHG